MNNLTTFNFNNFNVRTQLINSEPWFVAKDIADVLEYSETAMMTRRLDDDEVMSAKLAGMNMKSTFINESGLYSAIIGSNKPQAKAFKKWITNEVLPSIRKTGSYSALSPIDQLKEVLGQIVKENERLKRELAVAREFLPKNTYLDLNEKGDVKNCYRRGCFCAKTGKPATVKHLLIDPFGFLLLDI